MNPTSEDIQNLTAAINALATLMQNIFVVPDSALLATAWKTGFIVPASAGMVAWCVAKLVSMFND